jgi:hypothetical protein
MEKWKHIKGYEGFYQVSSHARVRGLARKVRGKPGKIRVQKETMLKQYPNPAGYLRVILRKDNVATNFYVHRLVAAAFIPNRGQKPNINHRDGNPSNNKVLNLEWCNQKENLNHSYRLKPRPGVGAIPVRCLNNGRIFESHWQAARELGLQQSCVSQVSCGRRAHTEGYRFERVN